MVVRLSRGRFRWDRYPYRAQKVVFFYFGGIDAKVSDADCKSVSFGTRCFKYIYLHHSWVAQRQSGTLLKSWSGVRSSPQELIILILFVDGTVAQLVEQHPFKVLVTSSNLVGPIHSGT